MQNKIQLLALVVYVVYASEIKQLISDLRLTETCGTAGLKC